MANRHRRPHPSPLPSASYSHSRRGQVHPHTAQKVLFVADTGNNRVAIFVRTGDSLAIHHTLGEYGTADGQFDGPAGMAVHRGLLYVCDSRNDRVQTFVAERAHHSDPIWTHVSTLGSRGTAPGAFMQPAGVSAVDEELVVSEWEGKRVQAKPHSPARTPA